MPSFHTSRWDSSDPFDSFFNFSAAPRKTHPHFFAWPSIISWRAEGDRATRLRIPSVAQFGLEQLFRRSGLQPRRLGAHISGLWPLKLQVLKALVKRR